MERGTVFHFEGIGDDLPLLPYAARRALDAAGRRLALSGWRSMPTESRWELVRLGSAAQVDVAAVLAAIIAADPAAEPMEADDESRLAAPSPALVETLPRLGAERTLGDAAWQRLSPVARFALLHVASRGRPGRLRRAFDEIVGIGAGADEGDGDLTHLSPRGEARMVDVGDKPVTARRAVAKAVVRMRPETARRIVDRAGPKGDVLAAARIAGIMAAKRAAELIPLCHTIALTRVTLGFEVDVEGGAVAIQAAAEARDRTGVEMEAMVAASVAALTIYDMLKAVERGMRIADVVLEEKSGGRSGHYRRGKEDGT